MKQPVNKTNRVLNCIVSEDQETDWLISHLSEAGLIEVQKEPDGLPDSVDLREEWWKVRDQKKTGACVGFASADGVLRWHFVKKGLIGQNEMTSPRFIWMANKETDQFDRYPTTFIELSGTSTKKALNIARIYGCVLESDLPMSGALYQGSSQSFYLKASSLRIRNYIRLERNAAEWKSYLYNCGPILTRLNVDSTWMSANENKGKLELYNEDSVRGGHAVAIVGYTPEHFIIRNSWGDDWGDKGFAYASYAYAERAFTETYGAVL